MAGDAKADVRRLDRTTAMRVFDSFLHYARTGSGDVTPLHGDMTGAFRLGDYRVLFALQDDTVHIFGFRHRRQACR